MVLKAAKRILFAQLNFVGRFVPLISLQVLFFFNLANAVESSKPFWTEKSAFIEGSNLYVVGVASRAKTVEEGRQKAFENGKVELMNYAQVTSLEAQGLVIETQMTYEEPHQGGTVSVYRLITVPIDKLRSIQGRIKAEGEAWGQELKKIQEDLLAKQKELEAQTSTMDQKLEGIVSLQKSLYERAKQIDEQQEKVQALLLQLIGKTPGKGSLSSGKPLTSTATGFVPIEALEAQVKEADARLNQREQEILKIQQKALERIERNSQMPCKYVRKGMTRGEVKLMLGEADGHSLVSYHDTSPESGWTYLVYGTSNVHFNGAQLVDRVTNQTGKECQ